MARKGGDHGRATRQHAAGGADQVTRFTSETVAARNAWGGRRWQVGAPGTMWAAAKGWRMPGSCEAGTAVTRVGVSIQIGVAIIATVAAVSSCGGSAAKSQASAASSPAR